MTLEEPNNLTRVLMQDESHDSDTDDVEVYTL